MQPFKRHRGKIVVLNRANIDTDQIIPKQFLKFTGATGYGEYLFYDWRYDQAGNLRSDFLLNQSAYRDASILVAGNNFGCGSSREHAVWALRDFGIRVVIAPWKEENGERIPAFADIFRNNAIRNGLLTIELSPQEVSRIVDSVSRRPGLEATVDLSAERVTLHDEPEVVFEFSIPPSDKKMLLEGLDAVALTLEDLPAIEEFEKRHDVQWYGPGDDD